MREDWEMKRLKDVCQIRPPKKEAKEVLSPSDLVSFVPMKVLGINQKYFTVKEEKELSEVSSSYTYFQNKDVLLAKITPCFENGKLGIAKNLTNGIGFGSSEYIIYRPSNKLSSEYLYYFLNQESFRIKGKSQMTGAVGHKRIPKEFYENSLIPIPPLAEQKQIVTLLDKAFTTINQAKANLEKNIDNAKELFQSKLNEIFETYTTPKNIFKLGDVIEVLTDYHANGSYKILKENVSLKDEKDYAWMVRSTDFEKKFKRKFKYIDKHAYDFLKKSKIFGGELIISKIGNAGKVYVMPKIKQPCSLAMNLFLLRLKEDVIYSQYLYYYLQSTKGEKQILSKLNGTTTKTITKNSVRSLQIPITSIDNQYEVIQSIQELQNNTTNLESLYLERLKNLEELKKSILEKAFTGELTPKDLVS